MSKREQRLTERKRKPKSLGPITRRQQVAAIRQVKGQEIAVAVAKNIREAVKQEVETQLKTIKDTMLSLIDRVVDLEARQHAVLMKRAQDESNSVSGPERTEATEVQQDPQVVPKKGLGGADSGSKDGEEGSISR